MLKDNRTIREVAGPLMMVSGVEGVTYDELGEIELPSGDIRRCKVLEVGCLSTETKTRMCPPGWCTRFMKQNRSLKNFGLYRGLLMPFHTRRINRSTPIKSVTSSGDTFIKPIITKSFKTITEKVSIFANVKQLL